MDERLILSNGDDVRRLRRACGLSQEKLALLAGVSTVTVGRIERGQNVTLRTFSMIERALREAMPDA